ncbi:CD4-1 molecule isoform X2 [Alosa sapidissima]|uniref:CD4-1 molecule isoform X2 n=1 Tax=Alosa sapidissima TaxID=34773 RepID=UPI001C0A4B5F|nr:CD4-1 molecule isoform X2 [Alosa sapidissima]
MSWPSNILTEIHIFGSRSTSIRGDKMYAVWVAALLLMTTICPIWADRPVVVYAQQGGSIQLPTIEKTKAGDYMTWYFGIKENNITVEVYNKHGLGQISTNNVWKDRISVSDQNDSLIISKVTALEFGFFRYEQKNRQNTVNIVYKLYKVTLTSPSTVLRGEALTLNCNVEKSHVSTTITWIPPETVDNTQRRISNSQSLLITNLSWRDKGVWTCLVKYNEATTKATTTIHVVDLLPTPSEPIYTSTASSLSLPCSISSPVGWGEVLGKGLQKGGWTFLPAALGSKEPGQIASLSLNSTPRWDIMPKGMDGSALEKGHKGNDLSLRMKLVTVADRGNYTCALNFQKVKLERTVRVEVLQVVARPSQRAIEGQQLNLTCTLGYSLDPESELEVKWTPPKAVSLAALASTPHPHTLSVEASVGHSGRWKCELRRRNETLTSADVSLKIEKLPVDVWLWVGIASTGLIVILLIFIARALIKRRRQRTQRRKTRFCCCKNPKPQKGFYRT